LPIEFGSVFSELRRTAAQNVQLKGMALGRLASCSCGFALGGQCQRLAAK
jgi:hypothetical protein